MWRYLLSLCAQFAVGMMAFSDLEHCPASCDCQSDVTHLTVQDCHDVHLEQFSRELGLLLSSNRNLTSLRIVNASLTQVPPSVCRLTALRDLRLDRNRLTALPDRCLSNLSNLKRFSARDNAIVTLQNGVFDGLGKLQRLDLGGNRISSIELSVFASSSNLSDLTRIDLSDNNITSLEPWIYDRGLVGRPNKTVYIILRRNRISEFTNKMERDLSAGRRGECFDKGVYASVDLRENSVRHFADIWNGWHADVGEVLRCYGGARKPPTLSVIIGGDQTACDCVNYPFFKIDATRRQRRKRSAAATCNVTDPLTRSSKIVNRFTANPSLFVCELTERCPPACVCVRRPETLSLIHI